MGEQSNKGHGYRQVILFLFMVSVLSTIVSAQANCWQYDGNQTGCTAGDNNITCRWVGSPSNICEGRGCWDFTTSGACSTAATNGLPCTWDSDGGFCSMVDCFIYDDTNQTACEDNTIGITCEWFAEETLCDPPRQECSNFDNQQSDCFNTFFCNWNPNNLTCTAPEGPAPGQGNGVSPGCVMLPEPGLCNNMSGKCAWQTGK